jgi:two-component system, cell cycle response regulator
VKVLVADDDKILLHLVSARLRASGWQVDVAVDAMQAVSMALGGGPDVIVLDINMPGGTGTEVLSTIKASPKTALIPVLVLSGSIDPQDEMRTRALGAAAYLAKPVDVDALHTQLLQLIEGDRLVCVA